MKYNFKVGKRYECHVGNRTRMFTVTGRNIISDDMPRHSVTVQFEDTQESVTRKVYKDAFHDCEKIDLLDQQSGHFVAAYADTAEDINPTFDWTWREREKEGDYDPEYWAYENARLNGDIA